MRCAAITSAGERCKVDATNGSNYCWNHAPENSEARKARARRGGKARGAGELGEVRRRIDATIEAVRAEELDKGIGAVVFQGFNTLLKAVEVERKIKESEELEARLEALERGQEGGRRWGA